MYIIFKTISLIELVESVDTTLLGLDQRVLNNSQDWHKFSKSDWAGYSNWFYNATYVLVTGANFVFGHPVFGAGMIGLYILDRKYRKSGQELTQEQLGSERQQIYNNLATYAIFGLFSTAIKFPELAFFWILNIITEAAGAGRYYFPSCENPPTDVRTK